MYVDPVKSSVGDVEFCVIHTSNGFIHLFYTDAFTVLVGLSVLLIFICFGTQTFPVGCARAVINDGVRGWLLRRRIVRSSVLHSEGCWVF